MSPNRIIDPCELGAILGVWAHPDDEAYLMAGTAMLAAAGGASVACVTATAGEAGESADEDRWPQHRLAEIRRAEMRDSLAVLGIDDHHWFDLADGALASIDLDRGVALVDDVIERVRPDTVLTFGADGMTGHPDHVAVGEWASAAVERSMRDIRVLAATKTPSWYQEFPEMSAIVFPDGGPSTPLDEVALAVQLPDELADRKVRALRAQASQTAGLRSMMGEQSYRQWARSEHWVDR